MSAHPIRFGFALAVTVAIAYTACAFVFWLRPEAAASFMSALFHGLDFSKLQSGPLSFSFASFWYALAVLVVWAFLFGVVFGVMQRLFEKRGSTDGLTFPRWEDR